MRPIELTCQELVEMLTDYLDSALRPRTETAVRAHLDHCPFCQLYLDQLRGTIEVLGTLRER